jgi:hypothetical protein
VTWIAANYKWLFDGFAGAVAVALAGAFVQFVRRRSAVRQEAKRKAIADARMYLNAPPLPTMPHPPISVNIGSDWQSSKMGGSNKLAQSPVATGKDITQSVTTFHAENIHIGQADAAPAPARPSKADRPKPNIQLVVAEIASLEDLGGGSLIERGTAQNAIIIRFSNDARPGVQNVGAPVKAALIYLDGETEIRSVIGHWLGHHDDHVNFKVDGRHSLVGGLVVTGELKAVTQQEIRAHRRVFFHLESYPVKNFRSGTILVRLTNANTGDWLYEKKFTVSIDPLTITPSAMA